MKKIVALVLCLALALSLCTVAFAAEDTFDLYLANKDNIKAGKLTDDADAAKEEVAITTQAAKVNSDGSGLVECLVIDGAYFVKVSAAKATVTDYAVTEYGEDTILYYVTEIDAGAYQGSAKEFKNFGVKTGQLEDPEDDTKYYEIVKGADLDEGDVYVEDEGGSIVLLVGGKTVTVGAEVALVAAEYYVSDWKLVDGDKVPTTVKDKNSDTVYTKIYEADKAPAGSDVVAIEETDGKYVFVKTAGNAVDAETSTTVESAKTFDAGIALYAGMALASVAGSAVVIGKKKEF